MKVIDVELRPVHHRLEDRVRAHASSACSPPISASTPPQPRALTFTDTEPPPERDRFAPAVDLQGGKGRRPRRRRTLRARRCAAFVSFSSTSGPYPKPHARRLLTGIEFDLVATPTPTQRRVFELLGVPVPKRLV